MILLWIEEAVDAGARRAQACVQVGLDARTVQRWRAQGPDGGLDRRDGPRTPPRNALSQADRDAVLAAAHRPEFRDSSPKIIVPTLADQGEYLASESTFYRVLRAAEELTPRGRARPPTPRPVPSHTATGPNQVWSWDITYLPTLVRGVFLYLYLVMDIWSRKIVGWAVHSEERSELAAELVRKACEQEGIEPGTLVLHSDNGASMRGASLLATLQKLGVVASFSRPSVSDDNAFSEALFRTVKYVPWWPSRPFADVAEGRGWVQGFVGWYNTEHLHSGIAFVTPASRHDGTAEKQLARRREVYAAARHAHPERWTGEAREWSAPAEVSLNARHPRRSSGPVTVPVEVPPAVPTAAAPAPTARGARAPQKARVPRAPLRHPSANEAPRRKEVPGDPS